VTVTLTSLKLSEWETVGPDKCPELAERFLDASPVTRDMVSRLAEGSFLELTELRAGLQVKAFSHVGRVQIGDFRVTILPKIKGTSLLSLLRYAYGFRRLNLISDSTHLVDEYGFEDLLIHQLNAEIEELITRGLLRAYISMSERLGSPRGRIDLTRMALDGGTITATLPCRHYPRIEDTLLNRVLVAGLRLAATMASVVELRRESRRLGAQMEEQVSQIRLDATVLERAARQMNRLTTAYSSALSIIRLLVEAQGIVLEGETTTTALPGFLFDMNVLFQALLARFLRDNLPEYAVRDEFGLKGMMRYNPKFNPQRRQSPTPRPDYVVIQQGMIRSILDAKYRDLWEKPLPRDMLYQLVIYAMSRHRQSSQHRQSSILYPTMDAMAKEARIDVNDPIFGESLGQVCLRPVHLPTIEALVTTLTSQGRRDREAYAKRLAFGEQP
jgi:5-methylcytosine-specific restriction enzyme subunit McrC